VRVPPGHSTNDILRFLTETKAGFCEQFAGSMAVLLRALGIPTRVAVGFTAGVYDSRAGVWRVTSQDAHAWVEVLFPGFGWLAFEPTPGRTNPVASYTNPPPSQATSQPAPASTTICRRIQVDGQPLQRACASSPLPQGTQDPGVSRRLAGEVGPQRGAANAGRTTPLGISARRLIVVGLLLLLALMVLSIPAVKVVTRRLRVFRSSEPRARILAQYAVLSQQAADVGWGRGPAETLLEYRARLKQGMSLDGDLDRLTELASRAAYAETITAAEAADHAGESARRLAHQIRKSAGVGKSLAGWFRVDLSSRR
jgi:hypothetical protein